MELITKVGLAALIIILLAFAVLLLKGPSNARPSLNATQAEAFVLTDLYQGNPSGNFSVLNVSPTANNSWRITVGAIYNGSTPCPTYLTESFDYPSVNLAPVVNNIYVSDCTVHEVSQNGTPFIYVPAVAIAYVTSQAKSGADYVLHDYLSTYGYNSIHARAKFFAANPSPPLLSEYGKNLWVVNYTASTANYSVYVAISESGLFYGTASANVILS
jgi:hypothetical protein